MNEYPVEDWVKKAEDNYTSALTLARRKSHPVPDVICNQCQQCAEKYLKALLIRHGVDFPKTHDLRILEDLVSHVEPDIRLVDEQLQLLNPYGIDVRYPGVVATVEEGQDAIKFMKSIRVFIRARLGLSKR